jgi:hypothetical protein
MYVNERIFLWGTCLGQIFQGRQDFLTFELGSKFKTVLYVYKKSARTFGSTSDIDFKADKKRTIDAHGRASGRG